MNVACSPFMKEILQILLNTVYISSARPGCFIYTNSSAFFIPNDTKKDAALQHPTFLK
jgi:hypothetical protein